MDVRKKFILQISVLVGLIIVLGVALYFLSSGTTAPQENDDFSLIPIDTDDFTNVGIDTELDTSTSTSAGDIIGDLTIEENIPPIAVIHNQETVDLQNNEAKYRIILSANWSPQLHPNWYPSGAHLSPMIAWSHKLDDILFRTGTLASEGMEIMAETGAPPTLVSEIEEQKKQRAIFDHTVGKVFDAPGSNESIITLNTQAKKVSVVSMIAPSPDWFIAARNIYLFENGEWSAYKKVSAQLYDAGTDSGETFEAEDNDTDPKEHIRRLESAPILPIASFEFIKL